MGLNTRAKPLFESNDIEYRKPPTSATTLRGSRTPYLAAMDEVGLAEHAD
jgi:hypothetical protein